MYKVMLVDDDYPVLELLSETIEWEELGLELQSTHENGASALQYAMTDMPDILITDIGMPKMNGIQLIEKVKKMKENIQVCVLTCHSDFDYAQQAIRLNVKDYILKDTLNPVDLISLLLKIKEHLDIEDLKKRKEIEIEHIVERNKEAIKQDFLRKTIHQPIYNREEWYTEAYSLGLDIKNTKYIPALCFIQDYRAALKNYGSEETLLFSIQNVIGEELKEFSDSKAVHFTFHDKESFLFFPYRKTLKSDSVSMATEFLFKIQRKVLHTLNISISFIIGTVIESQRSFKTTCESLLNSPNQRFYMKRGEIQQKQAKPNITEGLYSWYDVASVEIRNLILEKDLKKVLPLVNQWIEIFQDKEYSSDVVKEWVLKLLLDLKVKLKALQFFGSTYTVEVLHEEVLGIESVYELQEWLVKYFDSLLFAIGEVTSHTRRKEVIEACKYVSINIEKKISLDEVAGHLFLNPSYFSRLFKKEIGETFVEYVTKSKVNRAKELLEQTIDPVGRICERLGYDNQSYFIKVFKNYVGITPNEYRGERA
ncbi:response regulator transcription factor [Bacillus sinesaloumensis]|uniref:response regulator transcription factor n=1 Tax=Litchfieldia sinesaloumensis TaxID=1926280 RepID=UPI00098858C7|nr:response regulator [Bacillus sinesaloumensis]